MLAVQVIVYEWDLTGGEGRFFECSQAQKNPIVPVGADVGQLSHVDQGKSATVFRESASNWFSP
jgi:hypothetical protein